MPDQFKFIPPNAPDFMVVPDPHVCVILDISHDTLRRLDQRGEGPAWVQLSTRRRGRTIGAIREFLQKRSGVGPTITANNPAINGTSS